jgi:hypothetical protein
VKKYWPEGSGKDLDPVGPSPLQVADLSRPNMAYAPFPRHTDRQSRPQLPLSSCRALCASHEPRLPRIASSPKPRKSSCRSTSTSCGSSHPGACQLLRKAHHAPLLCHPNMALHLSLTTVKRATLIWQVARFLSLAARGQRRGGSDAGMGAGAILVYTCAGGVGLQHVIYLLRRRCGAATRDLLIAQGVWGCNT